MTKISNKPIKSPDRGYVNLNSNEQFAVWRFTNPKYRVISVDKTAGSVFVKYISDTKFNSIGR